MSKLILEALSKMPKRFIDDDTIYTPFGPDMVFIANPKYRPMVYTIEKRRWRYVEFTATHDDIVRLGEKKTS
ncbi:MAG: hypothetical protein WC551_10355 [Patescibacteria group bacterium]